MLFATMARIALPLFLLAGCQPQESSLRAPLQRACPAVAADAGPWFPTLAPSEHGNDSRRTHLYAGACATVTAPGEPWVMSAVNGLPGLYNSVTRGADEVFALGGAFGNTADGGPYLVRLHAHTLELQWRTPLPGMAPDDWNYPGALGVHRNGDLYVIYGRHLARVDAATGAVKGRVALPVNQSAGDVAYNGFVLLADGMLVAKSIHRLPGCTAPDYKAFLQCETDGMAASTVALVDPETMSVRQSLVAPEHLRFRATVAALDGTEYVYVPGESFIRRYRYAQGELTLDESWRADYRAAGQTSGTAVAALGEWVVIQTNGIPAPVPLSIVAVSQRDAAVQFRSEPFADSPVRGSFIPSLPTVDEAQQRVYTFDGFAGELAALDFDAERGFSTAWRVRQRSFAFSALVGPPEARVLVATDFADPAARIVFETLPPALRAWIMRHNRRPRQEQVVWRRAADGVELARTPAVAAVAGSVPMPGPHGGLFMPDLNEARLLRFLPAAE